MRPAHSSGAVGVAAPLRVPFFEQTAFVAERQLAFGGVAVGVRADLENDEAREIGGLFYVELELINPAHQIIRAGEADAHGMRHALADAPCIRDFGEARSLAKISRAHRGVSEAFPRRVEPAEKVAAADIARPAPAFFFPRGADHRGPHVGDGAVRLSLIRLIANALAPSSERALIPELIAAPADE